MCFQRGHAQPPAGTGERVTNPTQVPPSALTSSENCELIFAIECWPKTNRLSDISPAKMGLFRISRELQFGVCNYGEPRAGSHLSREGEYFYRRGKGSWEGYKNRKSVAFHWLNPCQKRRAFLSLVGVCYHHRAWELPVSQLINWNFCLLIFTRVISKTPIDMHPWRMRKCQLVVGRWQRELQKRRVTETDLGSSCLQEAWSSRLNPRRLHQGLMGQVMLGVLFKYTLW